MISYASLKLMHIMLSKVYVWCGPHCDVAPDQHKPKSTTSDRTYDLFIFQVNSKLGGLLIENHLAFFRYFVHVQEAAWLPQLLSALGCQIFEDDVRLAMIAPG